MTTADYRALRRRVSAAGYAKDIRWAQSVKPPRDADKFFCEFGWVVCNSGMRNQVAEIIWRRILAALHSTPRQSVFSAFKHPGKSAAIQTVFDNRARLYSEFLGIPPADRLAWIENLPWIGPITKYHLAKNFGVDCAKPDRHLVRIATGYGSSVDDLCAKLAASTGDRVATVDYVIWRAANLGWI